MVKERSEDDVFQKCSKEGNFIPQEYINHAKIKNMLSIVDEDLTTVKELKKKGDRWNTLYKLSYDIIHTLAEAFLLFDSIKSKNHRCLFSFLCHEHPELELEWAFFEEIRTKRNGIHYYGSSVIKDDWISIELQLFLYIDLLMQTIKDRL